MTKKRVRSRGLWVVVGLVSVMLLGCSEDNEDFKTLGFSSELEMKQIQAQGWRTKMRYDSDRLDAKRERLLVTCYGPYQHAANVANAKTEASAATKAALASEMRRDLVEIWRRKGFDERDAAERAHAIYTQYPPARPEYFVMPESAKVALEAGRNSIKACESLASQDAPYFQSLLKRVEGFS